MSVLTPLSLTLSDWAQRLDPDGKAAKIVELLDQTNEVLEDMVWIKGNLPTGYQTTIRTGLPSVIWRALYQGVPSTKSRTAQVTDVCGDMQTLSDVDARLVELAENKQEFLLMESQPFLEAMNQEFVSTLFYGDTGPYPAKFHGLAARYPYYDAPNVINGSGTGSDLSSMWLVVWGPNTCHGIFPKNSKAGLEKGASELKDIPDDDGNTFEGYRTRFKWWAGLTVRDYRYVVRICNLETTGTSNVITMDKMVEAVNAIPNIKMGRPVFYCNRTIKTYLDKAAINRTNAALTLTESAAGGMPVTRFWGIPIRQVDGLLNTEDALIATP